MSDENSYGRRASKADQSQPGMQSRNRAEIPQASRQIRELLVNNLFPVFVNDQEEIALTVPWGEEKDFQIGIFLYDIQDTSALMPEFQVVQDKYRIYPPKALELAYMIFCNESRQFGGIKRERIQLLLNEIIRLLHDHPVLKQPDDSELVLSFACLDLKQKIDLWGSFHKALQPAVYIRAVPLLIASNRWDNYHPVKTRDYKTVRKPDEMHNREAEA